MTQRLKIFVIYTKNKYDISLLTSSVRSSGFTPCLFRYLLWYTNISFKKLTLSIIKLYQKVLTYNEIKVSKSRQPKTIFYSQINIKTYFFIRNSHFIVFIIKRQPTLITDCSFNR